MTSTYHFGNVIRGERDDVHMVLGILRAGGHISVVCLQSETGGYVALDGGSGRRYMPGRFYLLDPKWAYELIE